MKILKIENNSAFYSKDGIKYFSISDIQKEDLKNIIDYILENDDFELDIQNDSDNQIKNKAESIIYTDIYNKLNELVNQKEEITNTINNCFKNLVDNYQLEDIKENENIVDSHED